MTPPLLFSFHPPPAEQNRLFCSNWQPDGEAAQDLERFCTVTNKLYPWNRTYEKLYGAASALDRIGSSNNPTWRLHLEKKQELSLSPHQRKTPEAKETTLQNEGCWTANQGIYSPLHGTSMKQPQ